MRRLFLHRFPAIGALLLFAAVQATMILWGFHKGERLDLIQVLGLVVALAGFILLVFPSLSAPPLIGSMLMLSAGLAWGIYSLRGKVAGDAIAVTTGNFVRAALFAAAGSLALISHAHVDVAGIGYAIISGAITSGLGYVIWYSALSGLRATSAATVQLSVPVLAAAGGILLLGEPITLRYVFASVAVLGGIALVIWERTHAKLTVKRDRVVIADQRSANGTYVNGARIERPVALAPGDRRSCRIEDDGVVIGL
jgi:drug/metabolite transporter (DMT)-like permease